MHETATQAHALHPSQRPWREIYFNRTTIAFWGVHVAAIIGVVMLGWSWTGLALALALYVPRMFFVTAGNHRYFSHRSYRTSRAFQFVLALCSVSVGQRGVLWWASHHRRHHRLSDKPGDVHSPREGFWWAHMGWMLSALNHGTETDLNSVKDLARYPELRWLERFWMVPPVAVALLTLALGGGFGLVWGFFVCQVLFWHATFTINSLSHVFGTRRFETRDDSRNNFWLALLTFGEGWHNNHHSKPGRARQGMPWWEIDLTYYGLRLLAAVGLVWDLRDNQVPAAADKLTEEPSRPLRVA
jgi:stearoyl-CoA desaturase (delta-9 desaturase)